MREKSLKVIEKNLRSSKVIDGEVAWRLIDRLADDDKPVLKDGKPVIVGDVQLVQK